MYMKINKVLVVLLLSLIISSYLLVDVSYAIQVNEENNEITNDANKQNDIERDKAYNKVNHDDISESSITKNEIVNSKEDTEFVDDEEDLKNESEDELQKNNEDNNIEIDSETYDINSIEIEEGIYYIHTKLNEKNVLDIEGQDISNLANVQIWNKSIQKTENQMFKIEKTEDGYYKIEALHSGKVLDVVGGKKENCTNVQQYEYNGSDAQKWQIIDAKDGYVSFISVCNGLYLDVAGASKENGANVQVYEQNGTDSQKFKLDKIEEIQQLEIEEGIYYIHTKLNEENVLDIEGKLTSNSANVQIWRESDQKTRNQMFKIEKTEDGYYKIEALHSGKVLDVFGGKKENCTNVQQYEYNGSDAQKWQIIDAKDGYVSFISVCNGLYLDVAGASKENGANVQVYEQNGTDSQKFKLDKIEEIQQLEIEEGIYYIHTKLNEENVLDIEGKLTSNSANVQVWAQSKEETKNQMFKIEKTEDGYYKIEALHSGKVLDVFGGKVESGTNVQQYEYNESDAQKWQIVDEGDGYISFVSVCNRLYLDVAGASKENGANVQVYEPNGTDSQKFKLEKYIEIIGSQTIADGIYTINVASKPNIGLDIANMSKENGGGLQLWESSTLINNSQRFKIEYLGDIEGAYKITVVGSGKVLEAMGRTNSSSVQQYDYRNISAQKWIIKEEDGYYSIVSKLSGLYLDIKNGNIKNGTRLDIYEENGTEAQKFIFKESILNAKQEIPDGIYKIATKLDSNMVLDVSGGSYNNGANVQIWKNDNVQQKKFEIIYHSENNGYYEIKSVNSGKVLDIAGASTKNGANVQQYEPNGTEAQQWIIQRYGDGYCIASKLSGQYLDIAGGKISNGTNVQMYDGNDSLAQIFYITETQIINNSVYEIKPKADTNKSFDIPNATQEENTQIQIWDSNGLVQQKFDIRSCKDGSYKIISRATSKVLSIAEDGIRVVQQIDNDLETQKWEIEIAGNGYYYIKSKSGNLYINLSENKTNNGNLIQVLKKSNTSAQMFMLKEQEISYGIDVSYAQNSIDWNLAKQSDKVDFAIIRVGWYSESQRKLIVDNQFEKNYREAKEAGIKIGLYLYSYASSVDEARREAQAVINYLNSTGRNQIDLPLFYDIEDKRQLGLSKNEVTQMCTTFGETVKAAGFKVGIYSYLNFITDKIDMVSLPNDYDRWIAHFVSINNNTPNDLYKYLNNYDIWQYTSSGRVNGITTSVDMNVSYKKY